MKEVYNSKFAMIYIEEEKALLNLVWTEATDDIKDEEYKTEILNYLTFVEKYQPDFIIDDARLYGSAILPETQEWVGQTTFETFQKYVKKYAMLMPEDFFALVSADLNIDEVTQLGTINIKQFKTEEEAKSWIHEK